MATGDEARQANDTINTAVPGNNSRQGAGLDQVADVAPGCGEGTPKRPIRGKAERVLANRHGGLHVQGQEPR